MAEPYIIRISSQKGGVGKTTVATNLGASLSIAGSKVLIVDADSANPSVGFHLGMNQANIGYKEVMAGKIKLDQAIAIHGASGLRVLPGTVGPYSFIPSKKQNEDFFGILLGTKYDFIIIDTSPGYSFEEPYKNYSEALIVATADMPSCTSAVRLSNTYTKQGVKHNLIVNRLSKRRYEFSINEIEDMYNDRIIGALPEDNTVPESLAAHIPVLLAKPNSNFSKAVKKTARQYVVRGVSSQESDDRPPEKGVKTKTLWYMKKIIGV